MYLGKCSTSFGVIRFLSEHFTYCPSCHAFCINCILMFGIMMVNNISLICSKLNYEWRNHTFLLKFLNIWFQGSSNSYAIKKKDELERVAKSNRWNLLYDFIINRNIQIYMLFINVPEINESLLGFLFVYRLVLLAYVFDSNWMQVTTWKYELWKLDKLNHVRETGILFYCILSALEKVLPSLLVLASVFQQFFLYYTSK